MIRILGLCAVFVLLGLMPAGIVASPVPITMQVGEVRVMDVPDVARVAVGDGHVLNAVTTTEKEVIVFARNEGSSALQVWSENGQRLAYLIDVAPERARQVQHELRTVLERIPNIEVSTIGDKLLVEGDTLTDADRERVVELAKRYPQLLDFTGAVGWDSMVMLDVQVLELPRSYLREFGFRWNPASEGGLTAGLAWDGGTTRLVDRPGIQPMAFAYPGSSMAGYVGINAILSAQIDALIQTGQAVVLAQPQLLARSGTAAEFLAGGEVPYSTVDANGNTNTEFKPYGVSLRITPQIERNRRVRSRVEVEVSSVDTAYSMANGPALKTRRASTEFNVRSGETLVLAGFVSRDDARNTNKVPGLGNIAILGELFRSRRFQRNETELAIFVTPVVVSASHPDMRTRVERGRALIDAVFPQHKDTVNVAIRESDGLQRSVPTAWNPWEGAGSQWRSLPSQKDGD